MTADAFMLRLLEEDGETVLEAVRTVQTRLRKPPVRMTAYLARLEQLWLLQTAALLRNRLRSKQPSYFEPTVRQAWVFNTTALEAANNAKSMRGRADRS